MEERLRERLESERKRLLTLEEKTRRCKEGIASLEERLRQRRFSEAEDVIFATGLTLDEIVAAARQGDFSKIQAKVREQKAAAASPEAPPAKSPEATPPAPAE